MSERWVKVSEKILNQLKHLEGAKKKDRLELVRSMRFVLRALEMSLVGWKQWVNNPDIMTKFTKKDLDKMNSKLSEFTRSFIEYDIEATKLGTQVGLKAMKKVKRKKEPTRKTSYVA
ncbi:DUF2153 domain-containing protein [Candidatus Bathyarchaeota archaeon]|nr:DUF2153 domain-containing protein [Candidatus Bathyarchaeota archaeon]